MAASRAAGAGRRTVRLTKTAVGLESSDDEFGILQDERCIDTGVFPKRYLLHESVFACSDPPPLRPHISFTILTQTDRCACENSGSMRGGSAACCGDHESGCARDLMGLLVPQQ